MNDLTGTWMHRAGTRVEIEKHDEQWQSRVFMTRHGGTGTDPTVYTDPDELRERLKNLEAQGYIKLVPGQDEPAPLPSQTIGVILIVVVILIVFFVIATS